MGGLKNIISLFPNYFNVASNKNFFKYLLYDYYFLPICLLLNSISYTITKQYNKLILGLMFFVGYALLINLSYPTGADQFYLENQYLILSIIVGFPFAYDFLPSIKEGKTQILIIGFIALAGIFRIYNNHYMYTNRLNWYRKTLADTSALPQKKLVIPADKAPKDLLLMTWGSSYEFWLLSTIEEGVSRSIIIEETANEFDWAMSNNKAFIAKWGTFDYDKLNPEYFKFYDESPYVKK